MLVFLQKAQLYPYLDKFRKEGKKIAFVPTMGALHEGHLSLVELARAKAGISVASIFVNPTQFNDPSDLEKYPRPISKDIEKLEKAGCDILYLPEVEDVYASGVEELEVADLNGLDTVLEGKSRPGHFQGVVQVVSRLLDAVRPDYLVMGQKDFQQVQVVRHFLRASSIPTVLEVAPIIREETGLAMSSRNVRLSTEARKRAGDISVVLKELVSRARNGNTRKRLEDATDRLNQNPSFRVDYLGIYSSTTLEEKTHLEPGEEYVVLTAVYVEGVRLLDNMLIPPVE